MKKWFITVLAAFFAASIVAGCSSSSSTEDTLETVKKRGSVQFAMSGGYPPFNYRDENGDLVGFDVDIAAEVAKRLGVESDPVTTAWDGIIAGLTGNRYDGILGSMAITEERLEAVDFSDPYYLDGSQLLVRKGSGITGPQDLNNSSVAIATGTTYDRDAQDIPGITEIKRFEDDNQTLSELRNGRVDGVITGYFVAVNAVKEFPDDFELAGPRIRAEEIAVAIRKNNPEFVAAVNQALADMKADGTYAAISEKWFGMDISK